MVEAFGITLDANSMLKDRNGETPLEKALFDALGKENASKVFADVELAIALFQKSDIYKEAIQNPENYTKLFISWAENNVEVINKMKESATAHKTNK